MKRKTNLIPKIAYFDNLQLAYYKAKRHKESKSAVYSYSKNLPQNLYLLKNQIESGRVDVGNYHYFTIYDPKEREICAASFHERVLHHAIMNVCHDTFENHQLFDSYATRLNKGTYKALDRAKLYQKRFRYFHKFDIRKYFDSINHKILHQMLCKLFNDKQLLDIFWQIINSYHKTDGKGVPIGNLTSQYFANHYLAGIDLFIKKELKIKGFVRYMDDFVIWGNEKFPLHQAAYKIEEYLDKKLSLKLKTSYCKTSRQGLPFLGYVLYPYKVLLSKRSKKRFADKMTTFTEKYENGEWSDTDFQTHATAVTVFTQYANAKGFRRRVLSKFKPV